MQSTGTTPPSRQLPRRADRPCGVGLGVVGGLGLNREADGRWGAQHVIEVAARAYAAAVPDAPPVAPERLQRAADIGLEVRTDTVAARDLQVTRRAEGQDAGGERERKPWKAVARRGDSTAAAATNTAPTPLTPARNNGGPAGDEDG